MGRHRPASAGLALCAALLLMMATSSTVAGQTGTALRISPPNFELEGEPGQVIVQQIRVTNRGESPLPVTMQIAGFTPVGQEGQVVLTEEEQSGFGIVSWITVTPQDMLLLPAQEELVTFLIEIPEDAPPGGHYASILASIGGGEASQGVTVGQRVGSLVILRVAGEVIETANLVSLGAPGLAAKGPIVFNVLVRNSGNVHLRPAGTLTVKGTFGGEITKLLLEQKNVLPDSERAFDAVWETGWRLGRYTIEYQGFYGTGPTLLTGSAVVFIFPWPIVLPVLAILALMVYLIVRGRQRFSRAFRVLAGRE